MWIDPGVVKGSLRRADPPLTGPVQLFAGGDSDCPTQLGLRAKQVRAWLDGINYLGRRIDSLELRPHLARAHGAGELPTQSLKIAVALIVVRALEHSVVLAMEVVSFTERGLL